MRVEGICDFEIVGDEIPEGFAVEVAAFGEGFAEGHVGAAVGFSRYAGIDTREGAYAEK